LRDRVPLRSHMASPTIPSPSPLPPFCILFVLLFSIFRYFFRSTSPSSPLESSFGTYPTTVIIKYNGSTPLYFSPPPRRQPCLGPNFQPLPPFPKALFFTVYSPLLFPLVSFVLVKSFSSTRTFSSSACLLLPTFSPNPVVFNGFFHMAGRSRRSLLLGHPAILALVLRS